jgi:hypothetical protein
MTSVGLQELRGQASETLQMDRFWIVGDVAPGVPTIILDGSLDRERTQVDSLTKDCEPLSVRVLQRRQAGRRLLSLLGPVSVPDAGPLAGVLAFAPLTPSTLQEAASSAPEHAPLAVLYTVNVDELTPQAVAAAMSREKERLETEAKASWSGVVGSFCVGIREPAHVHVEGVRAAIDWVVQKSRPTSPAPYRTIAAQELFAAAAGDLTAFSRAVTSLLQHQPPAEWHGHPELPALGSVTLPSLRAVDKLSELPDRLRELQLVVPEDLFAMVASSRSATRVPPLMPATSRASCLTQHQPRGPLEARAVISGPPPPQERPQAAAFDAVEPEQRDDIGGSASQLVVPRSETPKANTWQDRMNSLVNQHVSRAAEELEHAKALAADIPLTL